MTDLIAEAITRLAREEGGRVVALLARRFGNLDVADEAVQAALVVAVQAWERSGVPDNPAAWLYTVARNSAIDELRREAAIRRRTLAVASEVLERQSWEAEPSMIDDDQYDGSESLRLMLLCCHPALDRDSQVALTLRLVGGLTTPEIAAAFLIPEATLAQRIVRAKRKIRAAGIPLSIPASLDQRVGALLGVLYLVFNEGYLSRSREGMRVDLVDEAVRLTRHARELLPENAEVEALLALELYAHARTPSRVNSLGDLVLLADQDRSAWDQAEIDEANGVLHTAMKRLQPGAFQLQAMIAAQHANATTAGDTDWALIAALYAQLTQVAPSPVVALNHAIAVAMADGPLVGLTLLERVDSLQEYHLFHATKGELLLRAGRRDLAHISFVQARALTANAAEQRHLERRLADC
ncbi:sigma-70 family RNA polymerase sigma factor [Microbacterium sp. NPDC076911]|uniref:RNA polymerase sigma factor n=1 Tax=Microbacterium sp. NPDC076911 TaxID=3154958 RepID=UPI0034141D4D